ncbi:MAG: D-alanyl-D-alanine carboxypeptidase family protein [Pyrinomonadaceae bacterium MAG19_C2-C3]|nr:D-alanyl-D-alanine carboxypeptidase family protein [Pyrinomonadaceae bacterium MAG19_C2-C3]
MRSNRKIFLALLCVAALTAFVAANIWRQHRAALETQNQSIYPNASAPQFASLVQPISNTDDSLITAHTAVATSTDQISDAVKLNQNARWQANLSWTFGGKNQRGWAIYVPLICQTVGADLLTFGTSRTDFPARLAAWQQEMGVAATGVLDVGTWQRMIAFWQADRLKKRDTPPANEMLTAPVTDFWDLQRPAEERMVERQTYDAYKRMVAAAVADGTLNLRATSDGQLSIGESRLKIVSAYRSRARQEKLRRQSPNSGRAGLAINSPHFTGRALDLYVGGEPVDTKDANRRLQTSTPVYRWLVRNAARFGFRPYFYEPWHWEFVGLPENSINAPITQ